MRTVFRLQPFISSWKLSLSLSLSLCGIGVFCHKNLPKRTFHQTSLSFLHKAFHQQLGHSARDEDVRASSTEATPESCTVRRLPKISCSYRSYRSYSLPSGQTLWCSFALVQWGMQSTSGQCSAGTIVLPWPSPCRCNLRGQMVCTEEAMNDLNVGMVQIGIGYIPTVKEDHPSWANEQNG